MQLPGFLPGASQTQQGRVVGLVVIAVLALCFPQGLGITLLIEDVVLNLEGQPDALGVMIQPVRPYGFDGILGQGRQFHARPDQGPGLADMHVFQGRQIQRLAHGIEVDGLSPHHAQRATGGGEAIDHGDAVFRRHVQGRVLGQNVKSLGLQGITRQDRRGLVIGNVAGGLASPQGIIIHGGQVVVDERIDMNHLHGGGGSVQGLQREAQRLTGGIGQQRTQPLAPAQRGVAHGLMQALRHAVFRGQSLFQGGFGARLADRHEFLKGVIGRHE